MWVLFVACSALATCWAWRETRSVAAATLAGLVLAIAPGWFLLQQISPVSEPLLLVLVLVALLLAGDGKFTRGRALAFALVVGVAPLSRSIGVALVVPAVVMLLSDRGLARLRLPLAALAVLPFGAWSMLRASLPQAESYMDQLSVESMRAAFGGFGPWLLGQPLRMIEGAATLLSITPSIPAILFSGLLGALALLACVVHWRRLDAQFLLLYCGIVFVWPFPAEMPRFMALLFPVVIVLAARGGEWLLRRVAPSFRQQGSGLLVGLSLSALLVAIPGAWQSGTRMLREVDPALEPFKRTGGYLAADNLQSADEGLEFGARLIGAIEVLRDHVAPGECVYAVMPQLVRLYGKVRTVALPRGITEPEKARETFLACRYLFAISGTTPQYEEPPMYPAQLFGSRLRPVFVSNMHVDGVETPVVALFDLASVCDETDCAQAKPIISRP
jgi:hypothetical protein